MSVRFGLKGSVDVARSVRTDMSGLQILMIPWLTKTLKTDIMVGFVFFFTVVECVNCCFLVCAGINDPVADKLLKRAAAMPALPPPEDKTITTLYIGNLGTLTEQDIRYDSYKPFLLCFFSNCVVFVLELN